LTASTKPIRLLAQYGYRQLSRPYEKDQTMTQANKAPTKKQQAEIDKAKMLHEQAQADAQASANDAMDNILRTTKSEGQTAPKASIRDGKGGIKRYTNMLHLFALIFAQGAEDLGWEGFETFCQTILDDPRSELFGDTYQTTLRDMIAGEWQTDGEKSEKDKQATKNLLAAMKEKGMTIEQILDMMPEPTDATS